MIAMPTLPADIEFANPVFLWLLFALPLLWLRWRDRRLAVLIARTSLVALIVLILADPQTTHRHSSKEKRAIAFDVSSSIPPSMRDWMKQVAESSLVPETTDHIYFFGTVAARFGDWRRHLDEGSKVPDVPPDKTNLESLLSTVLDAPAGPRHLYLFTDGWENEGNVERLLPAAAAAGIKIYPIVPAKHPGIANVAVTKLLAPSQADSQESVNLKVVIENQNDGPVEGTLTVARNGHTFRTDRIKLGPGSQSFSYQAAPADSELTSFEARFTPRDAARDAYPADNRALAWVSVRLRNKLLLINGERGAGRYLEEILKRQGVDVTVRSPHNAPPPAGFKVVVFNNPERRKFSPGYLTAVEKHVAAGNGFIMLGSDASFAPGAYRETPIERILPVEPKEPPKREEKNRAVILVLDKSGSMRDDNRILYAKEAAKSVARRLRDIDLLGIVGFDDSAFIVVYLETMARLRGIVDNQIDRLKPGGQTYFLPALIEARRQLERANASRKHIVLLSDGVTRGSQGELVDLVSAMRRDSKITVSAVAISNEADVRIMKRLSQYGGGLFHHVFDPSSLPRIVLEQLKDEPEEDPKNEGPWAPLPDRRSELLAGLATRKYPAVLGFMETDLKTGAQMDLAVQHREQRLPLLASWRYARGKAIALTMDMESRWSKNWIPWGGLEGFWQRLIEWLAPVEEDLVPSHEARVNFSDNRAMLELSVYDEGGANSHYRYTLTGKGAKTEGRLARRAQGHYQAVLPVSEPGDYRIDIVEDRGGRRIVFPPIGYSLAFPTNSELPRPVFNNRLLSRLAEATGGEINPVSAVAEAGVSVATTRSPLKEPLIWLAAFLFLVEVALRKLVFAEPD